VIKRSNDGGKLKGGTRWLLRNNALTSIFSSYFAIPLVTRTYVSLAVALTALQSLGMIREEDIALHSGRVFRALEVWRPFTAGAFFGKWSLSMLTNIYVVASHCQTLEVAKGTADQLLLILFEIAILSAACMWMRVPFFSTALSSSLLCACSRLNPAAPVTTLFGFTVPYWKLPLVVMIIDMLHAQKASAAIPHLFGILTGLIYHVFAEILPQRGGPSLLSAPSWLRRALNRDVAEAYSAAKTAHKSFANYSPTRRESVPTTPLKRVHPRREGHRLDNSIETVP